MLETNEKNGGYSSELRVLGIFGQVYVYNPDRKSDDIYSTTIHELAHASHWNMDHSDYNDTEAIVIESWARGVQRELTRMVYPSYNPPFARVNYTGIVRDMIDGFGTKGTSMWWDKNKDDYGAPTLYKSYNDQVSDYTLKQVEDALKHQETWNDWKNNIKNKYNNETENHLDDAFNYWNTK